MKSSPASRVPSPGGPTDLREQLAAALGDSYTLESELGGGGMSRVFLAHETALGRRVAIKVLSPDLSMGVSGDRFRREILLLAKLQHPHIVPVHTVGEALGLPYFTMPYVEGESLRTRIARDGELPVAESVRLLRDVAAALAYAHSQGIMHRDIKPDNVLLSAGSAVVADFGVAKAISDATATGNVALTSTGMALGTPAYMAPEQAVGDASMDYRVDIYAFGVMAYEMLTGRAPFPGRSPQATLAAHVTEIPESVQRLRPNVPSALAALVMRCLEKHAADRPSSANDILHALDAMATPASGSTPTLATPLPARSSSEAPPVPTRRARGLLFGAIGLGAVAIAALLVYRGGQPPSDAGPAPAGVPVGVPVGDSMSPDTVPAPVSAPPSAEPPAPSSPKPPAARSDRAANERLGVVAAPDTAIDTPLRAVARDTVAPQVLPPVQKPVPEAVPASEQRPDPRPAIQKQVGDYAAAIESENPGRIRQVYPALTEQQERDWRQFFEAVKGVRVNLAIASLAVTGDSADATITGEYAYENGTTGRAERQPVSVGMRLARVADGTWSIVAIR